MEVSGQLHTPAALPPVPLDRKPTQPPIQWVPATLSLGIKRSGREADHSSASSAEFKNVWSYIYTPPIRFHGVVLS